MDTAIKTNVVIIPEPATRAKPERFPWPRMSDPAEGKQVELGVDVTAKRQDIIKIVYKYFRVKEVSMEELLQEVYLAILHKNYTRSAHDPRKSSFGHYVYIVANNVCINIVNKRKKFENDRSISEPAFGDDESKSLGETIASTDKPRDQVQENIQEIENKLRSQGKWDLARYVRMVSMGSAPEVVREALTFGERRVTKREIRERRQEISAFVQNLHPSSQ